MFKKIILKTSEKNAPITAGELAEALLFYQNVHLVLDMGNLVNLIKSVGASRLQWLLNQPNITAVYCEETLAVHTSHNTPLKSHEFVAITLTGHERIGRLKGKKEKLQYIVENQGIEKKQARKFAERFLQIVPVKSVMSDYFIKGGIPLTVNKEINNENFVHEAVREILCDALQYESLPFNFQFKIMQNHGVLQVLTDLNYSVLTEEVKKRNPNRLIISEENILSCLFNAHADIIWAGYYGGDFYTSHQASKIIGLRHKYLVKHFYREQETIKSFTNIVTSDGRCVKEVINNGERTFDEFLKLLDQAQRFKEWVNTINPDENLIKKYFEEISRISWAEKLPTKVLRYFFTTVAGVASPTAGLASSAIDTFFLDKLAKGWQPNHFVNNLVNFTEKD